MFPLVNDYVFARSRMEDRLRRADIAHRALVARHESVSEPQTAASVRRLTPSSALCDCPERMAS
jgi:hypothetical protein